MKRHGANSKLKGPQINENNALKTFMNVSSLSLILKAFETGNREAFFQSWDKYLPLRVRQKDPVAHKFEFYANIYFAIYIIHPINK